MIPAVPVQLRLLLAVPIMALAVCLGAAANWIVPEMLADEPVPSRRPKR